MKMDIIILIIIFIGLIIYRYLISFRETGNLPYAGGFNLYFKIFTILNFVSFIWIFGFVVGAIVALLSLFQIIYSSFLWPFLVPMIIYNQKEDIALFQRRKPSILLYGGWNYLIIGLFILTIINFFVGHYSSMTDRILELFDGNYKIISMYVIIGIVAGNLLRIIITKVLYTRP